MSKSLLNPDLDLLCRSLCERVLGHGDYQKLPTNQVHAISSFLIQYNNDFSSSRESLNKSLQNWFQGKNAPSFSKMEAIAQSLGYEGYSDFQNKNKRKIQTRQIVRSAKLTPFQRVLLFSGIALFLVLVFPIFSGISPVSTPQRSLQGGELLISMIQAVVVIAFYILSHFTDFGGRDKINQISSTRPKVVQQALQQFFTGWKNLWLSFSIFYLWFCILYSTDWFNNIYAQSASDIITILSSLSFAYLFSVMDVESVFKNNKSISSKSFYTYLSTFTIGLSIASMLSILDRYYFLGAIDGMGTYVLGYANVIVMLYFFGRLESHYLKVNRLILLPLYTYAIIQIAYVLFFESKQGDTSFEATIIGLALLLKAFLFFLIREWIIEGKLETYFTKQREIK